MDSEQTRIFFYTPDRDPWQRWPADKFGMAEEEVVTGLWDKYNSKAVPIQDFHAWIADVRDIAQKTETREEFEAELGRRRQQRLDEIERSMSWVSLYHNFQFGRIQRSVEASADLPFHTLRHESIAWRCAFSSFIREGDLSSLARYFGELLQAAFKVRRHQMFSKSLIAPPGGFKAANNTTEEGVSPATTFTSPMRSTSLPEPSTLPDPAPTSIAVAIPTPPSLPILPSSPPIDCDARCPSNADKWPHIPALAEEERPAQIHRREESMQKPYHDLDDPHFNTFKDYDDWEEDLGYESEPFDYAGSQYPVEFSEDRSIIQPIFYSSDDSPPSPSDQIEQLSCARTPAPLPTLPRPSTLSDSDIGQVVTRDTKRKRAFDSIRRGGVGESSSAEGDRPTKIVCVDDYDGKGIRSRLRSRSPEV